MNITEIIIKIILVIPVCFWLYRDARARDCFWFFWAFLPVLAIFTSLPSAVGFLIVLSVIYLLFRPKGELFKCPHCGKNVHHILFVCPFCRKNAKRECIQCHEPVPWEAEQCPFCNSRDITKE